MDPELYSVFGIDCAFWGSGVPDTPGHIMRAQQKNPKTEACVKDLKTTQEEESLENLEILILAGLLGGSDGKESTCNAGDLGLISGLGDALEKGMATHSSILLWRTPWTEEPGGLQFMKSLIMEMAFDKYLTGKAGELQLRK